MNIILVLLVSCLVASEMIYLDEDERMLIDDGVSTMESLIWHRAKFGINLVTSLLVRIL